MITATGTVQSRYRRRPLFGLCLVTAGVSYQVVILVLHSRLTLSCRHRALNSGCPEGKGRVTPRYPREVLRRDDREGTTDVLVYLDSDRCPRELPKSRNTISSCASRDKVRRRSTLMVTAVTWWDDRAGTDVTGGPDCCR